MKDETAKGTYTASSFRELRSLLVVCAEELVSEVLGVVLEQNIGVVGLWDELPPHEHFLDHFVHVRVVSMA